MTVETYPIGSKVTFSGVAMDVKRHKELGVDEPIVGCGTVNGEPLTDDDGKIVYVPVYIHETDKCLMVKVPNIISVEPPKKR